MTVQCLTCSHWSPRKAERMAQHLFGACEKAAKGVLFGATYQRECKVHSAELVEVVGKRLVWVGGKK